MRKGGVAGLVGCDDLSACGGSYRSAGGGELRGCNGAGIVDGENAVAGKQGKGRGQIYGCGYFFNTIGSEGGVDRAVGEIAGQQC